MLNKEICKRCYTNNEGEWTNYEESLWNVNHIVDCSWESAVNFDEKNIVPCYSITIIPKHCPYKLEHVVSQHTVSDEC